MKFEKEIKTLEYFNQNVEQLHGFNFWKNFPSKSGINIQWDFKEGNPKIKTEVSGPNEEAISAFILKYRMFIQDKDDISLRNLDKLYASFSIENDYYERFKASRQKINNILDEISNVTINKHKVTIREIHDMFIYGFWSHLSQNDLNRKRYLRIKDNPALLAIFTNDFNVTLIKVMNELVQIKFLNEEVIDLLRDK
jgi:hypothetical protein